MGYVNNMLGQTNPQALCKSDTTSPSLCIYIPGWWPLHLGTSFFSFGVPLPLSLYGGTSSSVFSLPSCLLNYPLLKTSPCVSMSFILIRLKT